jgi:hypothetical protein
MKRHRPKEKERLKLAGEEKEALTVILMWQGPAMQEQ